MAAASRSGYPYAPADNKGKAMLQLGPRAFVNDGVDATSTRELSVGGSDEDVDFLIDDVTQDGFELRAHGTLPCFGASATAAVGCG